MIIICYKDLIENNLRHQIWHCKCFYLVRNKPLFLSITLTCTFLILNEWSYDIWTLDCAAAWSTIYGQKHCNSVWAGISQISDLIDDSAPSSRQSSCRHNRHLRRSGGGGGCLGVGTLSKVSSFISFKLKYRCYK